MTALLRCAWLLWLLAAAWPAAAQNLESALRPGELIRGHAKWDDDCAQCHVRFNRAAQNELCMSCHKDVGADIRGRQGYHGRLEPRACRSCHTDHKGRDARIVQLDTARFDHTQTDWALQGRHDKVECRHCHPAGRKYASAPQDCNACHRKDDVHKGSLGAACADCHGQSDWKQTRFDHDKTRFALTGRHADTRCADCHRNTAYRETPRSCVGCHRKDDDGPRGHKGRFGDRCESCHGAKAWKPSGFNHETDARWPLRGKHRSTTCLSCHTGTLYRDKTGSACIDCHRKDDRHQGSLGRECQGCHTERDWKETTRFDHDRSRYPLLGRHREARCEACHSGQRYVDTPTDCVACHRKDDRHQPSLGEACRDCHSERDWKDVARLDHARTRFALRERHAEVRCDACHRNARYRETPRDCIGCHKGDDKHEGTLGSACADCHGERRWVPAPRFDHQRTRFPLRQAHAARTLACKSCHTDARAYRLPAIDCVACHRADDRHEGQLGTRCETCHDERRWTGVRYDHARARFPLVGRHLPLACDSCHKSVRYRDAARDCDGCHAKDDVHKRAYGTACESCHNARAWTLWTFDHRRRARWPLDGAHERTPCQRCHVQPAPRGRAIAPVGDQCIDCHVRDDRHEGAFGSACQRCHQTEDWKRVTRRTLGRAAPPASDAGADVDADSLAASLGQASWFHRALSGTATRRRPS
ncbi:MAG: cytochrome c3 family protein [Rubrivivax sp.]